MRVKRYVVESMPAALQLIRKELGSDAVILNTKEIRSGGFLGMFSKKKIEVIAAVDAAAAAAAPTVAAVVKQQAKAPAAATTGSSYAKSSYAAAAAESAAWKLALQQPTAAKLKEQPEPVPVAVPEMEREERRSAPKERSRPSEDQLLEELRQMKEMMHKLSRLQEGVPQRHPSYARLHQRLLDQDVLVSLAEEIVRQAEEAAPQPATESEAFDAVRQQLKQILSGAAPQALAVETRIAHFVGPTGVGKTTTIAKLAAEQVLKHHRKVGFITSDTYRIAAVEQLKTYATILNVPLEVVFSPQELARAFQQLEDCDVIFMDTAGRNFRNQMYVSELNSLLHSRGQSETFLVLSLTGKYADMKEITENFAKFKLDKVLFTKMDETHSYGSILNLLHDFPVSLSYLTHGQNVPDDIIHVNEARLIDLILGERGDE